MDTQRIIALIVFMFSGMLLWEAWNKPKTPIVPKAEMSQNQGATKSESGKYRCAHAKPLGSSQRIPGCPRGYANESDCDQWGAYSRNDRHPDS